MISSARPSILAVLPGFIPSTMITVVKPLVNLHRAGRVSARIVLESQAGRADIDWADAIVFCRNTEPRHAAILDTAQARGTPLIYDLDDNLFELPPDCGDLSRVRGASRQAMLEKYVRAAALVRVYSQPLADRVAALNRRVVQSFAPVDLALVPPPCETRAPGPIKIVYTTSRTQDALCEMFMPALARILDRYGSRVEAHFWGCCPPRVARLANVRHHGLICQYDRYLRRFSRSGYDIGLAPLPNELFYRSKTNNKFREYGASGVAGVYSQNEVYAGCVEHEVSGLLVSNDADAWYETIVRLIEDEALRTRIQRHARKFVQKHYSQTKFEGCFLAQLRDVLSMPADLPHEQAASPDAHALAVPGYFARLGHQARRSLGTMRRLGPRQAWSAMRWFVNDRCLAAWLRWQLRQ